MKKKVILTLVMMALLLACNLPFVREEPQDIFDQPAQTLTALFAAYPTPTGGTAPAVSATSPPEQATDTPVPPTAVVYEREAQQVTAQYLSKKPVLDGDWGDWKQSTVAYPAYYVVYGLGEWEDDSDLEASFVLGWDESYLYVGVKVKDDVYAQNESGEKIFKGDSVEILLDTDLLGDFNSTSLNGDDFQLGFSPGKGSTSGAKEAYRWYPVSQKGSIISQVDVAAVSTLGIYRVELRIPWSVLQVTPSKGMRLGFLLSVSDNDDVSANVQQSMVSNAPKRVFTNPTTWGELVLK